MRTHFARTLLCTTLLAGWSGTAAAAEVQAELRADGKLRVCDQLFDVNDRKAILGELSHCPADKRRLAGTSLPGSILLKLDVGGLDPPGPIGTPPKPPPPPPPRIGNEAAQRLIDLLGVNEMEVVSVRGGPGD